MRRRASKDYSIEAMTEYADGTPHVGEEEGGHDGWATSRYDNLRYMVGWHQVDLAIDMKAMIDTLDERRRKAMILRHCQGWALEEIGTYLNVSRERARQLCEEALKKLRVLAEDWKEYGGKPYSRQKLTQERVSEIKARYAAGCSKHSLAKEYHVGHDIIYRILSGERQADA
jgi:Mor family transcriptional regulator